MATRQGWTMTDFIKHSFPVRQKGRGEVDVQGWNYSIDNGMEIMGLTLEERVEASLGREPNGSVYGCLGHSGDYMQTAFFLFKKCVSNLCCMLFETCFLKEEKVG